MNSIWIRSLCLTFLTALGLRAGDIVINEIMYYPPHPLPEDPREEWVELFNRGASPVNLRGWRFSRGIQFTFTSDVVLAPGAYLVVAADEAVFRARYPGGANVVGGWTGQLSNGGETLELRNAADEEEDQVQYSDSGEWAVRLRGAGEDRLWSLTRTGATAYATLFGNFGNNDTVVISGAEPPEFNGTFALSSPRNSGFRYTLPGSATTVASGVILCRQLTDFSRVGWAWSSRADGLGSSLEVINPWMPNEHGQNWQASPVVGGTPGRANSGFASDTAPFILDLRHQPLVPKSTEAITITARIADEQPAGLTVTLRWRVDAATPPAFSASPMFDDGENNDGSAGDGLYGIILPPHANNTVIEFYVEAQDRGGRSRTWPAPALDANSQPIQQANALLQVDNTVYSGPQPIYRITMREAERAELQTYPNTTPASNARMNTTFISIMPDGTAELRYLAGVRDRGAGSRSGQPANYQIRLPGDRLWNGVETMNLNVNYTHAQLAGYAVSSLAGLNTEAARAVQVRVNNVNRATSTSRNFGSYIHLESTDGDYAQNHFPNDPDGNLYRGSTGAHSVTLDYLGTNFPTYANAGYFKQNNTTQNDWSDLFILTDALDNIPDAQYVQRAREVANVEEWMRYFAVFSLLLSRETSFATGRGDDFSMFRGVNDPRFLLLAHDWDTILNEGDTRPGTFTDSLFRMCPTVNNNANTYQLDRFMLHPEFTPIYFRELLRLCDTVFSPAQLNPTLDQMLGGWVPANIVARMKVFAANRAAFVRSQIPLALNAKSLPSVTLTNPPDGAVYGSPANLTLAATATDTLGIQRVDFYQGATLLGQSAAAPYTFAWNNISPGSYTLRAVATDLIGLAATSAPVSITLTAAPSVILIASNSVWKYLDDGSDQGTAWRAQGFNDGSWAGGPAQLGYGDGDEATVVSFGPNANSKYITTYFRRAFFVTNAAEISGLNLWLLRDDGAVVYLNGTEIYRVAMPGGAITYTTLASANGENSVNRTSVPVNGLVTGNNVLAVEVHQQAPDSSDVSFDFELRGVLGGPPGPAPAPLAAPAELPAFALPASASPGATVFIGGQANVLETRAVKVNGTDAAWTSWQGLWTAPVILKRGANRVLVQSFDGAGRELERTWLDLGLAGTPATTVGGNLGASTTWTAAASPYYVTSNIAMAPGTTLTVEAGTTVYFATNAGLTVVGRLLVNGTELNRVRFTGPPGGTTNSWPGLIFRASGQTNTLSNLDLEFAGTTNRNIRVENAILVMHSCTFSGTTRTYLDLTNAAFGIYNCEFPSLAGSELIHGTHIRNNGFAIIQGCRFGTTTGLNDIIDFTGGQRPGPILQVLNNVFTGASDDHLDLDGTDAHIEGNLFIGAHQETPGDPDTASAISGGSASGNTSELTIVRNIFYDCDHAVLAKEGNFYTLANNTIIGMSVAAVNFNEPLRGLAPGLGARLDGNIIWHTPLLFENYTSATMQVTVDRSVLPSSFPGTGNVVADPRLANTNTASITWRTLTNDFRLLAGSPGLGTGPNGLDMGALVPAGASIRGEPASPTAQTIATLTVAGPGITHYSWKLNNGAWSAETPVATPITLSGLGNGDYTVSVLGKNSASVWQATNQATLSKTWTVNTALARLVLNEVLARNNAAVLVGSRHPDLIELHNAGGTLANLAGMGLTDDPTVKFKFTFPANTSLAPGGYLVVIADDPDGSANLFTGFGLGFGGDALYLYDPAGNLVDSVQFGLQLTDLSIGRIADETWGLTQPTFGAANVPVHTGDPAQLRINEWLAAGRAAFSTDFIELFNLDSLPVGLGGLWLTDNPIGWPTQHWIAPLSFIAPRGFSVFFADDTPGAGSNHVNFKLSADRGAIALLAPDLSIIDQVIYGPQTINVSEGRQPDGGSRIVPLNTLTPGSPNPGPGPTVTVTNIIVSLIDITNHLWRYDASGTDRGTAWQPPGYNDSAWPQGRALFGFETTPAIYPYPFTTLVAAPANGGPPTAYYRARFQWTNTDPQFVLYATNYLDDGAVYYLNGVEVDRIRMPTGTINFNTGANNQPNEGQAEVRVLPSASLVIGENVLAVQVHQAGVGSSDTVFGLALAAVRPVTNFFQPGLVLNEVMANNVSYSIGEGAVSDWVEIFNPSTNTTDLAGMSLTDDIALPQRWVFPAGVTLPPNSYLVVRFDSANPPSTNGAEILNTGFGLGANTGDEVYLFSRPTNQAPAVLLDSIVFGIQPADFSIGRLLNSAGTWVLNVPTPGSINLEAVLGNPDLLRVNEWMADPASGDDWFEIFNPDVAPVALSGLFLTDDLASREKYRIPALSFIGPAPGGFLEFKADNNVGAGANHVNFRLSAGGESLGIFKAGGFPIDAVSFGPQTRGVSEGRFADGATNIVRFPGTATPGESNLLPIEGIVVNEILAHTDLPYEDAIELQNVTASAIDVSGWFLTDNRNNPRKFRIPAGSIIEAGGFLAFYEYQFNPFFTGIPPGFALSAGRGDEVYLFRADADGNLLGYRTGVTFGASENGLSLGRHETSVGVDFTALSRPTFGTTVEPGDPTNQVSVFRTGRGAVNAYPKVGPVVVNEIMYHPPSVGGTNDDGSSEYLELLNVTSDAQPLYDPLFPTNTWRLRDAVDFDFPHGASLPPNGYALVVSFDPNSNAVARAAFLARYALAPGVLLFGPFSGRLANDNDNIELYKPDAPVPPAGAEEGYVPYIQVDKVRYADRNPWPTNADGAGASLQRLSAALYGNDPVNWIAGNPTPAAANGPPIIPPPVITIQPMPRETLPGADVVFLVEATGAEPLTYQWRFNGSDIPGAWYPFLALTNVSRALAGSYTVRVSNPGGAALSSPAALTVIEPPVLTRPPVDSFAVVGSSFIFDVLAVGTPPLSYQWQRGGTNIPAATNAVLLLTNLAAPDETIYRVAVANAYGAATSAWVTLTLNEAPGILVPPQGANVFIGTTVTLDVRVSGTPPFSYQWRLNGAAIPGATNATLTLTDVQTNNSGAYSVRVSNRVGQATSDDALLLVTEPPVVTVLAADPRAVEPNDPGLFVISRTGSPLFPLTVQFIVSGTATAGGDYEPLFPPVTLAAGMASTNLVVRPLDDAFLEGDETIILTLLPAPEYVLGTLSNALVVLRDDDNLPPIVTLTSPSNGALFDTPANVLLRAEASDPEGALARVVFFSGTNRLGEALAAPFQFLWANAPSGVHVLTALAYDALGASGESAPVIITNNAPPVVAITSPPNNSVFGAPAGFLLSASAFDFDSLIARVEFYRGDTLIGTDLTSPYSTAISGLSTGVYAFTARAIDERGSAGTSAPVTVLVNLAGPNFADMFAQRGSISGYTNQVRGTNTTYTLETGEPLHDFRSGTHSAWITWVAPASGPCTLDTFGSSFDTVLAVYTNSPPTLKTVTNLLRVASNDDAPGSGVTQSRVTFNALAGVAYEVAVDGFDSTEFGTIIFHQSMSNPCPVIVTQPVSQVAVQGESVTFTVNAAGFGLSYQWQFNGANLPGQTGPTLLLNNAQAVNEGFYVVRVSNPACAVWSDPASLTVDRPPTIVVQPQPAVADPGSNATFSVAVSGPPPFSYQWHFNGAPIGGGNGPTYTRTGAQPTHAGAYAVTVGNAMGSADSQNAELIVRPKILSAQMTNSALLLLIQGTPGRAYAVEIGHSVGPAPGWTPLGAVTNTTVEAQFLDATVDGATQRVYRLRLLP